MVEVLSFVLGLGFFKACRVVYKLWPYLSLNRSHLSMSSSHSPQNKLKIAVISGATDGVGKAFAKLLYQQDYNLIVLGRSQQKLTPLKQQLAPTSLSSQAPSITPHLIDFSQLNLPTTTQHHLQTITQTILSLLTSSSTNLQILIINSCGDTHISTYSQTSLQQIQRLQAVNLRSFHLMAKLLYQLRQLAQGERYLKREFTFINVSSQVGYKPQRYSSIYSATKAYCSNVMTVLGLENTIEQKTQAKRNTFFLNLTPLYIKTKMVRYLNHWDVVNPQDIVQGAFKLLKRRQQGAGTMLHQLLKQFPFLVSKSFAQRVQKALQFKRKLIQMQNKRKLKKNNSS